MCFLQSNATDLEIAAIIISAISVVINAMLTVRNSKKKSFIEAVTKVRMDYVKELRAVTADFCHFATAQPDQRNLKKEGYKLKLMMNPAGYRDKWDGEAVKLIDSVLSRRNPHKKQKAVNKFVALMQSWFALEWSGIMEEAKKGVLSGKEKDKLRNKFYKQYKNMGKAMNKKMKKYYRLVKRCFCRKGIIFILAGFIALGAATGHILWDYDLPKLCGKILLGTGLAGLGIGLLVAGFFLLHIYKRYDEHYLNNL